MQKLLELPHIDIEELFTRESEEQIILKSFGGQPILEQNANVIGIDPIRSQSWLYSHNGRSFAREVGAVRLLIPRPEHLPQSEETTRRLGILLCDNRLRHVVDLQVGAFMPPNSIDFVTSFVSRINKPADYELDMDRHNQPIIHFY